MVQSKKVIPYSRQSINYSDILAVKEVLRSDFLTTGPKIEEFERKFAAKVGSKYAISVNSGTAALHCAMFAIGIKPGDKVLVPAITFVATANAVKYCGGEVIFADVDRNTLLINVNVYQNSKVSNAKVYQKSKLKSSNVYQNSKLKAIITVDYAGQTCDIDTDLPVISDSCHSLRHSKKAIASCHSFHPVKHITTGEGGMVTTDSLEIAELCRGFRNHGRAYDGKLLTEGYNYRLSDIACALGISQFNRLDDFLTKRKEIAKLYDEAFKEVKGVEPLAQKVSNYHLYIIKLVNNNRDKFRDFLKNKKIETQIHYESLSNKCYVAVEEAKKIVSIPIFPELRVSQQHYIIEKIKEYFGA